MNFFRSIELLNYLVKYKSISKAAEAMKISRSAASRGIQSLEENFGSQLLLRSKNGLKLTDECLALNRALTPALQLKQKSNILQGANFSLMATRGLVEETLPFIFSEIEEEIGMPSIEIIINSREHIIDRPYDLIIGPVNINNDEYVSKKVLVNWKLKFYAHPLYFQKKRVDPSMIEPGKLDYIVYDKSLDNSLGFSACPSAFFSEHNIVPKYVVRSLSAMVTLCNRGVGVAFITKQKLDRSQDWVDLFPDFQIPNVDTYASYKKTSVHKKLINLIITKLEKRS